MVLIQLTLERFEEEARVRCGRCGLEEPFARGAVLPASGGALEVQEGRVVTRTCGACWEARRSDGWACSGCRKANPQWMNWCLGCGTYRPDPRPYAPDWELLTRDEADNAREARAYLEEVILEFGSAAVFGSERRCERI
ncbi:MAG: hypothetical protein KGI98_15995 [Euryarchaeota archaeon]|nr:hypothetical protein [Euryarchaeota archaeon]MDE1881859.1 hypothetical protein [Euryarchaeota archaeon]